ncbi:lysophospholipid acyltransferase family protein [Nocardioides sp. Kera G14]|uniref:lysophospholipid acyltransferase family protein n=1 Tax=Nocardioides sp. Kera G14 TaxID=2884264 RepID=UPI001D12A3D9|nr:lysophospholipid acyltransferase family protein [Nocardioides sp. Kera G14]UDY22690.1 1-acyl-sn-glycerol-3-phosphate acyltransferase [Nocardioides sp. Kera G14]
MGKFRKPQQPIGPTYRAVEPIIMGFLKATTRPEWIDGHKIPATGGVILALNHVSHIDPLSAARLTWDWGRQSHYLAKSTLFKNKQFGRFLRSAGQIPVERAAGGLGALQEAIKAVNDGHLIVVYVEGSITKDPDGWPMVGKSGAARIALETGAPVIPVGQWGAQFLLNGYEKKFAPVPRKTIKMKVGDPVDLSDLQGRPQTRELLDTATQRIMQAIVRLVADLRGEEPPATLFDPKTAGVGRTGNPHKKKLA